MVKETCTLSARRGVSDRQGSHGEWLLGQCGEPAERTAVNGTQRALRRQADSILSYFINHLWASVSYICIFLNHLSFEFLL